MKNVRVLYSFPNSQQNQIVTVKLIETEKDVHDRFAQSPALKPVLEEFKAGKQIIVNGLGGWCWLESNASNGCNRELVKEIKSQKSVTFV